MSRMFMLLITVVLVGCGPRAEVAKKKALEKIDSLLGKLDVKREQISQEVAALKKGVDGLRQAKIKAKVKSDQINRKLEPIESRISAVDATLEKVRDPLKSGEPYEVGAKTYSSDDLKSLVADLLKRRKELDSQAAGFRKSKESLDKVSSSLERKQQSYQQELTRFESVIGEIDAKKIALKAMQDASKSMGESEATLAENVANLDDKIADLYAEVESQMMGEDEKWNEIEAMNEIDAVDAFIEANRGTDDQLAEIDAILGE